VSEKVSTGLGMNLVAFPGVGDILFAAWVLASPPPPPPPQAAKHIANTEISIGRTAKYRRIEGIVNILFN
jgi:hypothetical protein